MSAALGAHMLLNCSLARADREPDTPLSESMPATPARSTEGKVAFVRQLHEAKLVLLGSSKEDDNNKVKVELERFGFRVVSYPEGSNGTGDEGVSALGQFLIP